MTIEGIDVSHFQGDVKWDEVARSGRRFAFAKATDGPVWKDPCFDQNRAAAKKAGLIFGAYHFARLDSDPAAQAAFFKEVAGSTSGELPPAVDVEPASLEAAPRSNLDPPLPYPPAWTGTPIEWLREFDSAIHKELGWHPILYFPSSFWTDSMGGTSGFDKRHAWIAEYPLGKPPPKSPALPAGWTTWTFWQYSSAGQVPGISGNVDVDVFNGDEKALEALLR